MIHVLSAGLPLCGFTEKSPREWPESMRWLTREQLAQLRTPPPDLCVVCARIAEPPPKRVQRKRSKGYRTPAGVIYVGRPTIYGNPFVDWVHPRDRNDRAVLLTSSTSIVLRLPADREDCVAYYRRWVTGQLPELRGKKWLTDRSLEIRRRLGDLRGHDLACWCALDRACHADVLLDLANKTTQEG